MPSKPKRWLVGDEDTKFEIYRYEAPENSDPGLWIDLRWNIRRELYTAFRSNAIEDDRCQPWILFAIHLVAIAETRHDTAQSLGAKPTGHWAQAAEKNQSSLRAGRHDFNIAWPRWKRVRDFSRQSDIAEPLQGPRKGRAEALKIRQVDTLKPDSWTPILG